MSALAGSHIILGVTGGIAAYKAAALARLLVGADAAVEVVLSRGGARFIGAPTFEGITGNPVRTDVFEGVAEETHVQLGRSADVVIVYPATAHLLARAATGMADDLLTTTLLVARCPVIMAPAMHTEMWTHAATQRNVAILRERGITVLGPDDGPLMGGDRGPGRVVEPAVALVAVTSALNAQPVGPPTSPEGLTDAVSESARPTDVGAATPPGRLHDVRVLVTAGGTREPVDPVRFIGNRSSGRMGFAIAAAAAAQGARVTLVTGPTELATPHGVERVDVTTAVQMHRCVFDRYDDTDLIIKSAAVADFRPAEVMATKFKKEGGVPTIALAPNPDILAELGQRRGDRSHPVLVGFAAETDRVREHAEEKLARKQVDLLVVNDVSREDAGFEVDTNEVALLAADGSWTPLPAGTKDQVALALIESLIPRVLEAQRQATTQGR